MTYLRLPSILVRIMAPHGAYPSFDIKTPGHLFISTDSCIWSAVVQQRLPDEWERSEIVLLLPEEVRLFGAVSFCERDPFSNGQPAIALGHGFFKDPEFVGYDLSSDATFAALSEAVRSQPTQQRLPPERDAWIGNYGTLDDALDLLRNFDANDQLLIAGVARYLAGSRLMHGSEREESAHAFFASMSAGLEYVRQSLSQTEKRDVSFSEVHTHLESIYPEGSELSDYLEEVYEQRVTATHPSGRFGEYWTPPVMQGDIYHLRRHIILLYRYILLSEPPQLSAD
jgi:hypothetical protein